MKADRTSRPVFGTARVKRAPVLVIDHPIKKPVKFTLEQRLQAAQNKAPSSGGVYEEPEGMGKHELRKSAPFDSGENRRPPDKCM